MTFSQYTTITLTDESGDESTTTTLTGESGEDYECEVNALDAKLEAVGAVYAVTSGNEHVVLYVGETGDLSKRFDDHHKSECFDENKADFICVHREDNKVSRLRIESDLNSHYHPTCNGRQ
jgi:hypothetical protein